VIGSVGDGLPEAGPPLNQRGRVREPPVEVLLLRGCVPNGPSVALDLGPVLSLACEDRSLCGRSSFDELHQLICR
jgi:hypothetical protein